MKVASLLFIAGFAFLYFSLESEEKGFLITRQNLKSQNRSVANNISGKCMRDLFSVEVLKREVQELESTLDTNRIRGNWKHLDLSHLPTPAADFLIKHGNKLGVSGVACQDVPCLFNEIYETPDGIAGYVHYLWFLRTGVYLAADNSVPGQASPVPGVYNGRSFPVSSYLFDTDELYGFWRLSKMLRSPFSTLTHLKEIQRIPRGEKMEGDHAVACGLAHSDGWVTLNDQCLIVYPRSDSGYFFPAVLHELSHQLDFEEGKRLFDEIARSQREDFLNLTGFELNEYRNQAGQIVRQWILKPDARIVTMYGRNSPQENFAELLSHYRIEGDSAKQKVKRDSWEFASGYFHRKSFEHDKIASDWVSAATSENTLGLLKASVSCDGPECLHTQLRLFANEAIGKIRSQDPDGCRVLSNPLIAQTLPGNLQRSFHDAVSSVTLTPELRARIIDEFSELMNPDAAYESFFTCHASGRECFEDMVSGKKEASFSKFDEAAEELLSVYLHIHSFEKVSAEVRSFYKSLLASRDGIMRIKSDELWESCKKIPVSDSVPPAGSDYVVKDGYMVSSFYNCLNRGFHSSLQASLDAVKLKEFSPRNASERAFILSLMKPRFSEILDDHLRSGRAWEMRYKEAFTEQHGAWLSQTMRSNRWWVPRGRVTQEAIESACRDSALRMIGGEIYFHLKKDLYRDLLTKTCQGIR